MRALLVEDDRRLGTLVRRQLEDTGLAVDVVENGWDALGMAETTAFDVVILDVLLPGEHDGFAVCAELRLRRITTPILMLTARGSVEDRVAGLGCGADDYLVKPFAFRELLARVRALTRRHLDNRAAVLALGPIRLDTLGREVTVGGRSLDLTAKELAILEYFMHHPGRALTRTQIEDHVWNYDFDAESNLVEVYVGRIRRKLAAAGAGETIVTVRGVGYRLRRDPE
jgi:two-component system OmpR family response regulator